MNFLSILSFYCHLEHDEVFFKEFVLSRSVIHNMRCSKQSHLIFHRGRDVYHLWRPESGTWQLTIAYNCAITLHIYNSYAHYNKINVP